MQATSAAKHSAAAQSRSHQDDGTVAARVWGAWQHVLGAELAYSAIYLRDVPAPAGGQNLTG